MRDIRSAAAVVGLALLSTLFCVLLSEVIVRIALPQQLVSYDSVIIFESDSTGRGYRLRANLRTTVNTGERTVDFVTDGHGFRVPVHAAPAAPGDDPLQIIVFGDSFIQASAVDAEDAIPERLAEVLSQRMGVAVHATNAGVVSYGPAAYYLTAREVLASHPCDLGIVVIYVGNDIATAHDTAATPSKIRTEVGFTVPRNLDRDGVIRGLIHPLGEVLDRSSHLWLLVKNRSRVLLARLGLTMYFFPDVFRRETLAWPMWGATTRMCQTIAAEFARHDTPVLFVILPTAYQVSGSDFEDYVAMFDIDTGTVDIRLPNTILGSRFTDTSLDYVDVLDTLRRASVISGERTHGAVDHHLSPYGHRVVAEAIAGRAAAILSNAGRSR